MRKIAPPLSRRPRAHGAAVRTRDRGDDREPEADAAARARPRRVGAVEALEHAARPRSARGPGRCPRPRRSACRPRGATRTCTGAPGGVCARTFASRLSTICRRRSRSPSTVDRLVVEVDRPVRLDGARRVDRLARRARRAATGSRSSGRPSSRRASRSRSSTRTLIRSASRVMPRHRPREVVGPLCGAALEQLRVRAHRGERRAQLVRRVGDEPAQLALGRLACAERLPRCWPSIAFSASAERGRPRCARRRARRAARGRRRRSPPRSSSIARERPQAEADDPERRAADRRRARASVTSSSIEQQPVERAVDARASERRDDEDAGSAPRLDRRAHAVAAAARRARRP